MTETVVSQKVQSHYLESVQLQFQVTKINLLNKDSIRETAMQLMTSVSDSHTNQAVLSAWQRVTNRISLVCSGTLGIGAPVVYVEYLSSLFPSKKA